MQLCCCDNTRVWHGQTMYTCSYFSNTAHFEITENSQKQLRRLVMEGTVCFMLPFRRDNIHRWREDTPMFYVRASNSIDVDCGSFGGKVNVKYNFAKGHMSPLSPFPWFTTSNLSGPSHNSLSLTSQAIQNSSASS